MACEGDDSDSSNADTAVPISCSAIVIVTVDSDSMAAEGGSGAVHFFFHFPFFFHRRPHGEFACARARVLSLLVPRCDTVDSDSSRAVVPEMFHVAPHGFVLHCLAPCAVGCALLYVPIHGRTQTVIVGVQWGHRADFSPPLRSFPFFITHVVLACTRVRARHCGAV